MSARILVIDIETSPIVGPAWRKFDTNLIEVWQDWYIMCFAYKWYNEKQVHVEAQCDQNDYLLDDTDDFALCRKLHKLLDEADIIIAHNGDRFDIKKIQARLLKHGFKPPSPFKTVDTLKVARGHFALTSNKLDDIGSYLEVGRKLAHEGFELWRKCMGGCPKAWNKMKRYNIQDVRLLERVYDKLRPWMPRHPNMGVYSLTDDAVCAHCGGKSLTPHETSYYTNSSEYEKYQCNSCGGWSRRRRAVGVQAKKSKAPANIVCDRK